MNQLKTPEIDATTSLHAARIKTLRRALVEDPDNVQLRDQLRQALAPIDWSKERQRFVDRLSRVYVAMETARGLEANALRIEANRIEGLLREFDRWRLSLTTTT